MLFKIAANLIASLLMFALVMGLVWLLNGETRRQARIRAAGLTAWASLVSMHQTRTFTGGRFVMELVLDVEAASGSPDAPYATPLTRVGTCGQAIAFRSTSTHRT